MILDDFQKKAMEYISQGYSVIVSAPTGAGKTVIAEHVIQDCLRSNSKVIYTAPIKALSNQKFRDFQKIDPDIVGIMTGDVTLNAHAPILVMTTEIFRNKILEEEASLKDYSWIIFDEIHYLDDYERGTVWEESLIFLPAHMNMLGLSATIPNIDQLRIWLESIHHRPVKIVKETQRPVPLHFYYQCQGKMYDDLRQVTEKGFTFPEFRHYRGRKIPKYVRVKPNKPVSLIRDLEEQDRLPCIFFTFSRRRTEYLADEMGEFNFLDAGERKAIMDLFDALCDRFDLSREPGVARIAPLLERGIGYHHAGMLPTLKEVIEQLFTSRLLKLIFTTETFALGINMPARSVVFDSLRKFYGRGFASLRSRDFYQMAGRAGRRSIDPEGFVYCRVNPHEVSPMELKRMVYGQTEAVRSQFNASYATVLNLYQSYGDQLVDIYPKSFHYFQTGRVHQKRAVRLLRAKVDILKELGHIRQGQLTQKGVFAAKVYGYELILSELYDEGMLDRLSAQQLGILCLSVVYEPRKGLQRPEIPKAVRTLDEKTAKIVRQIHRLEKAAGIKDLTPHCSFHLSRLMEAWIKQKDFYEILTLTDADEGEIVRYLRMTLQVLRQIADGPVSESLREKVISLLRLVNRDVIDSEKQLRS